jgi:hypothetical protein
MTEPLDAPNPAAPTRRDLIAIGATGLAMRLIVLIVVIAGMGVTFSQYVNKGDGQSYILIAEAMLGRTDAGALDSYHHRVFLGYPAIMALLGAVHVPVAVAGLAITFIAAALAPVLAARFFNDRRVGWASVALVPHWVINSSLVMTEAPTLALSLLGLVLAKRQRWVSAGVSLGVAGLVRPMACFATIGLLIALFAQRRVRPALLVAAITLGTFIAGTAAGAMWRGNLLENARIYRDDPRAYGGELFALPFTSLIRETLSGHRAVGMSVYIWMHVAVVIAAIALLAYAARRRPVLETVTALGWLIGNTLFVVCIGSYWGYQHFPRFGILAQPAVFFGWQQWLPRRTASWLIICAIVTVFACLGVRSSP